MKSLIVVITFVSSVVLSIVSLLGGFHLDFAVTGFIAFILGWYIFKDSMNLVQTVGPVYWILRNNGVKKQPILSIGFMLQVDPPWMYGKGPQIRIKNYVFQVGFFKCKDLEMSDDPYLSAEAMGGYFTEDSIDEIRKWH